MKNKISVIIPAYNTADVISRTLKSVKQQTYPHYEIILINDGSTDGTKEIIDNYAKNRNNIIVYHQSNQGVSVARNKGIELATGEFICFLDSDDTYKPTFLEEMIKRQQETNANVVYCGYNRVFKDQSIREYPIKFAEGNILSSFLDDNYYFSFSCTLIKKQLLIKNKIIFDRSKYLAEDILFIMKVLIVSKIFFVKKYLFNYHYRANSMTNKKWNEKDYFHDVTAFEYIHNYINNHYKHNDLNKCIKVIVKHKKNREMRYLDYCLMNFKYKSIKNYINNKGDSDLNNIENTMHKLGKRKCSFIKSNNYFLMFLGTIYYRYIRINLKKYVCGISRKRTIKRIN